MLIFKPSVSKERGRQTRRPKERARGMRVQCAREISRGVLWAAQKVMR